MGQAISTTQFYLYGKDHCTQKGYQKHVKEYDSAVQASASIRPGEDGADDMNMKGKVVIVTGANSGIGKEIATYAAAKGARLYMFCRSPDKAEKAKEEIMKETSSKTVEVVLADLSDTSKVREAVEKFQSKEEKLDALVCSAGVLLNERKETSEGYELTFATHLLCGSYLLSQLLIPNLIKAKSTNGGEPRAIFLSSGGMYNVKFPKWETANSDPETTKFDGQMAYAYAKRGQVLLAERLTKDIPEIKWVSAHPGWVDTPAVDRAYGDQKKYLEPLRDAWSGAEGIAWLVGADGSKIQSGEFYLDRKTQPKHVSGPFFTEGTRTKNSEAEVDEMMERLRKAAGLA